jgi:hypothetical protein
MPRSWLARRLSVLVALLHLLVPPLVAVADGRLEREAAAGPRAHAESEGSRHCPLAHPSDCALCHAVAAFALPARGTPAPPPSAVLPTAYAVSREDAGAHGRFALASPRAPPAS